MSSEEPSLGFSFPTFGGRGHRSPHYCLCSIFHSLYCLVIKPTLQVRKLYQLCQVGPRNEQNRGLGPGRAMVKASLAVKSDHWTDKAFPAGSTIHCFLRLIEHYRLGPQTQKRSKMKRILLARPSPFCKSSIWLNCDNFWGCGK